VNRAPIVSVAWRACRAGTHACSTLVSQTANLTRISFDPASLAPFTRAPVGRYKVFLWLRDAAANQSAHALARFTYKLDPQLRITRAVRSGRRLVVSGTTRVDGGSPLRVSYERRIGRFEVLVTRAVLATHHRFTAILELGPRLLRSRSGTVVVRFFGSPRFHRGLSVAHVSATGGFVRAAP
jgi:hypothetical protein